MPTVPNKTIYGQNCEARVFLDGIPAPGFDFATKVKVTEVATLHRRNYLNRDRGVTDKHIDGYDISLESDVRDFRAKELFKARDALRDANQPVPVISVLLRFTLRDGTPKAYMYTECEEKVDFDSGDRTNEATFSWSFQAEDEQTVA